MRNTADKNLLGFSALVLLSCGLMWQRMPRRMIMREEIDTNVDADVGSG